MHSNRIIVVPFVALLVVCRGYGPVGAVVGGTLPADELTVWRRELEDCWFLVPGFGAQGAGPEDVRACFAPSGGGALISASRSVTNAPAVEQIAYDADPVGFIRKQAGLFADALRVRI